MEKMEILGPDGQPLPGVRRFISDRMDAAGLTLDWHRVRPVLAAAEHDYQVLCNAGTLRWIDLDNPDKEPFTLTPDERF